jgi:hypothetical protein
VPVVFQSEGGVRRIVLEITHSSGRLSMVDAVTGLCLPFGVRVSSAIVTEEGQPPRMIVTVEADQPLPAGVIDLFQLRVLLGDDIAGSGLQLRTLSINGEPVADAPLVTPDAGAPARITIDTSLWIAAEGPAVMDIRMDGFGASVGGPLLIDPDALAGGYVGFNFERLRGASEVRLRLGFDPAVLQPGLATAPHPGAQVSVAPGALPDEVDLTIRGLDGLLPGIVVLACLAFARPAGGSGGAGTLRLKGLSVDGADLPLEEESAGWADDPPQPTRAGAPGPGQGLSIALAPQGPVHMPDR